MSPTIRGGEGGGDQVRLPCHGQSCLCYRGIVGGNISRRISRSKEKKRKRRKRCIPTAMLRGGYDGYRSETRTTCNLGINSFLSPLRELVRALCLQTIGVEGENKQGQV